MLTARTYGRQRLGVRKGAACSFRSGDRVAQGARGGGGETGEQDLSARLKWVGGAPGRGLGEGTLRPAAERMSMIVNTVSNRTALPAFRLVSVFVATCVDGREALRGSVLSSCHPSNS